MSSECGIELVFRSLAEIIQAMQDLNLEYKKLDQMKANGKLEKVEVVVKDSNGRDIGFAKDKNGNYQVLADSKGLNTAQLKNQNDLVNKIRQKYAYNNVVNELKKQGYVIAEEEKCTNNTVRLVARKWSK